MLIYNIIYTYIYIYIYIYIQDEHSKYHECSLDSDKENDIVSILI